MRLNWINTLKISSKIALGSGLAVSLLLGITQIIINKQADKELGKFNQALIVSEEAKKQQLLKDNNSTLQAILGQSHTNFTSQESLINKYGANVEQHVLFAYTVLDKYEKQRAAGSLSLIDAQNLAKQELAGLQNIGGSHLWLQTDDYTLLLSSKYPVEKYSKWYQATGLINVLDTQGTNFIKNLVTVAKQPNGGFALAQWDFPSNSEKDFNLELYYGKSFAAWNWIIGSALTIEHIPQKIVSEFSEQINIIGKDKWGGAVSLSSSQGEMLYHSQYSPMDKPDWFKSSGIWGILDAKNVAVYKELHQKAIAGQADLSYELPEDKNSQKNNSKVYAQATLIKPYNWLLTMHFNEGVFSNGISTQLQTLSNFKYTLVWLLATAITGSIILIVLMTNKIVQLSLSSLDEVQKAMQEIDQGKLSNELPVLSADEIGMMRSYFNAFVNSLKGLIDKVNDSVDFLSKIGNSIIVSTKNVSDISSRQSEGLKAIVATMEEANIVTRQVTIRAQELSKIAAQTKNSVKDGSSIVAGNLVKVKELQQYSKETVANVRALNDRMLNVHDILKVINGIASQTKMIAFNAELEAAAAGEAGKNFTIVAMEIRRLSDSILQATTGIKIKILEAQSMMDHMVVSSEESADQLNKEVVESSKLNQVFYGILTSAEVSASSADQISEAVVQQSTAFEQILDTLKQLSANIEQFTELTLTSSYASESIEEIVGDLKSNISKYQP
ncbi:MAG: methyl-accepting chemotaxis sensory transducer [Chlamydiales bacterium]|jgi:methyl-accepting chemotaxis protein|nr:methyl-accepting chemotaxis sensory transducer [Chlamydiales bacterium]